MKRDMVKLRLKVLFSLMCIIIGSMSIKIDAAYLANIENKTAEDKPYVYFGNVPSSTTYYSGAQGKAIQWRVLSRDNSELFLLSEYGLLEKEWDTTSSQDWTSCTLNAFLNGTFYNNCFNQNEKNAIQQTYKEENESTSWYGTETAYPSSLNGERVFLLSAQELKNTDYGFIKNTERIAYKGNTAGDTTWWWGRSETSSNKSVATISADGSLGYNDETNNPNGMVRPAIKLPLSNILYVLPATDDGATKELSTFPLSEDNRLVLEDTSSSFDVSNRTTTLQLGDTLDINYTGAETSRQLVVLITEGTTEKYYGRYNCNSSDGTLSITIPTSLENGKTYKVNVYNEENNGTYSTNYAGYASFSLKIKDEEGTPISMLSVTVTSPATVTGTVSDLTQIDLKNAAISDTTWNIKQQIDWNKDSGLETKLHYKENYIPDDTEAVVEEFNNNYAIGTIETLYLQGDQKLLAVYSNNGNEIKGKKYYSYNGGTDKTIAADVYGYMALLDRNSGSLSDSEVTVQLKKIEGDVTIKDLPVKIHEYISISGTQSGNTVTVTISPEEYAPKVVKEVGVRATYSIRGIKEGFIKKTNTISGNTYTFTFENIPNSATYDVFCITEDNVEVSKRNI